MRRRKEDQGFTLIELLVALAILGVVVVPLLTAFLTSSRVNASAKDKQRATTVAQNIVEEYKAMDAAALSQAWGMEQSENAGQTTFSQTTEQTLDGQTYTAVTRLEKDATWNEKEISQLYSLENASAGIYVQDKEEDQTYCAQLKGGDSDTDDLLSGIRRDMDLVLTGQGENLTVTVQTTYQNVATGDSLQTPEVKIFDGKAEDLKHVYVFFQPMYHSTQHQVREVYTIDNRDLIPIDAYFVCQSPDATQAGNYLVQLRCVEKDRSAAMRTDPYRAVTKIHSNLDVDQQTLLKKDKEDRVGQVWLQYLAVPKSLVLTEDSWDNANRYEGQSLADVLGYSDLSNKTAKDHAYQLEVEVYKGHKDDYEEKCLARLEAGLETE